MIQSTREYDMTEKPISIKANQLVIAADVKSTEAFIIAALIMAYNYLEDLDKERQQLLKDAAGKASKFLKEFDLPADLFKSAVKKIASGKGYDAAADDLHEFALAVRKTGRKIKGDLALSRTHIALINSWQTYIRTDSERAWNKLVKFSGALNNLTINQMFHPEGGDAQEQRNNVRNIVKKLVKRADDDLTIPEREAAKEKNPKLYKQFLKERRELVRISRDTIMQQVRSSGQRYLPIADVKKFLNENNCIDILPDGFKGFVGDDGSLFTTGGKKVNGVPSGKVRMNPNYDPEKDNAYVFSATPPGGQQEQRYYTIDFRKQKNVKKAANVTKLIDKIETLKKKWRSDMKTSRGLRAMTGLMLEIAYLTQARIGTMGNVTGGESTYGLSTWQRRHFEFRGNSVIIKYKGKKGVLQRHVIKSENAITRMVVNKLQSLYESTDDPKDYLFMHGGKPVTGTMVNAYLRSIGSDVTVHKFRALRGTILAEKVLEKGLKKFKGKKSLTEREVNKWVKSALEVVGQELGHYSGDKVTATTAIRSYIMPAVFVNFYAELNIRPHSTIEKVIDNI